MQKKEKINSRYQSIVVPGGQSAYSVAANSFLLRVTDGYYALVGECYGCDLIAEENLGGIEAEKLKEEWFELH